MEKLSMNELQIAERAKKYKGEALTNLHQYITEFHLKQSYQNLNKNSSSGIAGKIWYDYGEEFRFEGLLEEFKSGKYKVPCLRRTYVPKGKTGKHPIGIPTIEGKVLQENVRRVLTPVNEEEFINFSYGYRSKHSPHQAIKYTFKEVSFKGLHHIIDADIKNYWEYRPWHTAQIS